MHPWVWIRKGAARMEGRVHMTYKEAYKEVWWAGLPVAALGSCALLSYFTVHIFPRWLKIRRLRLHDDLHLVRQSIHI